MDSKTTHSRPGRQGGTVLPALLALIAVILGTGMAFMRWASDESIQSHEAVAGMQAYYLGQMGVVEKGFQWLRTQRASDLPIGEVVMPGKVVTGYGEYRTVRIVYLPSLTQGDFWAQERRWSISSVGVVRVPVVHHSRSDWKEVKRKAVLYVQVRNFADYMYLSNVEVTRFNDRIKFFNGDTLQGRVHSNDTIAIMQSPVFYEQVSTMANDFWRGAAYNPIFLGPDPVFRAREVLIPNMADRLRAGAASSGSFYAGMGKTYHARFIGSSVEMWRWDTGAPEDSTERWSVTLSQGRTGGTCIFVDDPLWIEGRVQGRVTIGSSQTIRIINDIRYQDCLWPYSGGFPAPTSNNILGIVSESDVKVGNTWKNGRENSNMRGNSQPNHDSTDVVINAAIVALGESFTFENQNDPDSGYVCITPCNCSADGRGGGPDDRGQLFIYGSITQMRRGYVHRSNCTSTGYLKQYVYDRRLLLTRPPCFFDVTDEAGHALFDIVQWGQAVEYPPEVRQWNVVRYN
jgi:hypothetical protein